MMTIAWIDAKLDELAREQEKVLATLNAICGAREAYQTVRAELARDADLLAQTRQAE